jgi:tight adherence protein B
MALLVASLVFVAIVGVLGGIVWAMEGGRRVSARLGAVGARGEEESFEVLRLDVPEDEPRWAGLNRLALYRAVSSLRMQAGYGEDATRFIALLGALGVVGMVVGWARTGWLLWGIIAGVALAACPILYLVYKRYQRFERFGQLFPDALDMMARAIRAGNALTGSIQIVGAEMPDPVGREFRRVSEEVRFGLDPGEALSGLQNRMPTEDVTFFCSAIRIQRGSGGNLAEVLDRLSDVIRKRYELLSHARVLSAQHKWAAICVGLSPVAFSILFELMSPGYFGPLLESPVGPFLLAAGLVLEVIGFLMIWRISAIKV